MSNDEVLQLTNCTILRDHSLRVEDLFIQNGRIINPEELFYLERKWRSKKLDCGGNIVAPGFIDLQINGAFGLDFTCDISDEQSAQHCIHTVGKGLLTHGVTSYCPTLVTSPPEVYHRVLPLIKPSTGGKHGATVLGVHLEGPFISIEKKGAHPEKYIRDPEAGFQSAAEMYGPAFYKHVSIITIAPELPGAMQLVEGCVDIGITVSVGHTMAELEQGEEAVRKGARLVTHLFNAMQNFHHRDPGLVGLLTSDRLAGKQVWFGIIADGVHTHPAALRIAYKTNFSSLVLVTDAICAMGFKDGKYQFGQQEIEVRGDYAFVAGTDTLTGSVATMHKSVLRFLKSARCSRVEALEAASLHPALALGIAHRKGSLAYGADADFIILDKDNLGVLSTWIGGECVHGEEPPATLY